MMRKSGEAYQRVGSCVVFLACLLPVADSVCLTEQGSTCVFPFIARGNTYTSCTYAGDFTKPWCSTKVDSNGVHVLGNWGDCPADDPNCPNDGTDTATTEGNDGTDTATTEVDIETNLEANVTALEESVASLKEMVANLTAKLDASLAAQCDLSSCTSMHTTLTKLETCLGDISSAECPTPPAGKTGVATGISANAAAIENKCDASECTTNAAAIVTNTASIAANSNTLATKCDSSSCSSIQTDVTNLESCLGDISSSSCPAAAEGKTGVAGGIAANSAALAAKCDSSTCDANTAALHTKCDASACADTEATTTKLETCFGDISSSDCPSASSGKTGVADGIASNSAALAAKCDASTCDANTAALDDKCDATTCTAVQTSATKLVRCLGDISSSDCPAAPAGKTGVAAGVAANTDALAAKCDVSTCSEIQTTTNQLETCLGDISSADCPTATDGKTGMVSGITANTDALADKCESSKCEASTAALDTKCDASTCTTIQTNVNNLESCLADKSSDTCPAAPSGKVSVPAAITALETPPVFMCHWYGGDFSSGDTLAPYDSCDVNEGNVVDASSGKLSVTKPGKYRLTFMALMYPVAKKKVTSFLVKTTDGVATKIARAVAQSKIGDAEEQVTTTIDIIVDLAVGDTIHVEVKGSGGSKITGSDTLPRQVVFNGEFISA